KLRLQDLLAGRLPIEPEPRRQLAAELNRLAGRLRRDAATLARLDRLEQAWGRLDAAAADGDGGWWHELRHGWLAWRLRRQPPWWRVFGRYRDRLERYHETVACHLRAAVAERLEEALRGHRQAFSGFLAALRARRSAEQGQAFASFDFEAVLAAFPLMLTTFADAHRALPFSPGLFDLVMIDEATQCDMASALPVLERGRRALVTGDPRQLRHVSFLADRRQAALRRRHGVEDAEAGLDYRRRSLLDLALDRATSGDQVAWLDEHFRSAPAIIGFSNRTFYDASLRVMTRRPEEVRRRALEVIQVDGRRDGEGVNATEAAALVERLMARVAAEAELPAGRCSSLGVLSPFRAQVDHLSALVSERLSLPEIDRHRLRVGTPYGFQGDERDVMYLSLALAPDDHAAARRYLERPDVFNVALTRARGEQVVFTSVSAKELAGEGLLRRFLDEAAHREPLGGGDQRDPFLRQVAEALSGRGFAVHAAYPIAGMEIDLLAERDGRSLGIDLVGHPGRFAPAFDLDRCQVLIRAGLAMFPLPWSAWRRDREGCLEAVEQAFLRSTTDDRPANVE
ncbi:MAG TPA: AAA domain-containing protein, partial [Thermoanaerobaculia bacterium]|nr:AAA domain-containing protein [Thermoanaerobaculia bacterium]